MTQVIGIGGRLWPILLDLTVINPGAVTGERRGSSHFIGGSPMDSSREQYGYRGDRVRAHTTSAVNRTIDQETTRNIQAYNAAGPEAIEDRIRALELEWDVERVLETMASSFALTGVLLGTRVNKRFLAI